MRAGIPVIPLNEDDKTRVNARYEFERIFGVIRDFTGAVKQAYVKRVGPSL
jgi:hypothetical protein